MKNAKTLMIQGCTSDAGKSMLVTAICRWVQRQGVRVAPFKPQNMALNSAVTSDGGEIGRAQAVQAQACKIPTHTDMNPILLKPNSDIGAQVIVHGHAIANMDAAIYHDYKRIAHQAVIESHQRLQDQYQAIIVEGAGSPAEINLRENDIANMGFAEAVDCPVILIADIDRGGVFAHLVGTLDLLSASEQQRIIGFVINKFRGDLSLLQSGLDWLEARTGKPVLGVLPYIHGLHLESEDSVQLQEQIHEQIDTPASASASSDTATTATEKKLRIVVPALPHMSNHTDFDPLRLHPQVELTFVGANEALPSADLIILAGSKNVIHDLQILREQGWTEAIDRHLRYGGKLIGICGGFQILGTRIHDPDAVEGKRASIDGLRYANFETTLTTEKRLRNVTGRLQLNNTSYAISGYEIHAGVSTGPDLKHAAIDLDGRADGFMNPDNTILGTYVHGIFESDAVCSAILEWAGVKKVQHIDYQQIREDAIEQLADSIEAHLDTDILKEYLHIPPHQKKKAL